MAETITKWMTLETITCYKCGIVFAVPQSFKSERIDDGQSFWCPNGHSQAYVESTSKRLEDELKKANARLTCARENADRQRALKEKEERRVRAYRGVVGRFKKRVGNGICPCCNRTFKQLSAHMESKHPNYKVVKDA